MADLETTLYPCGERVDLPSACEEYTKGGALCSAHAYAQAREYRRRLANLAGMIAAGRRDPIEGKEAFDRTVAFCLDLAHAILQEVPNYEPGDNWNP